MSSTAHQLITAANNAFSEAADQVEHILGQALQLQPEDPKHLSIAMDMAKLMHEVFSKHAERVTILSPLVLSAGTELMNHMDEDRTALVTAPVWASIVADNPHIQGHPLFPATAGYRKQQQPLSPLRAGPSQPKGVPHADDAEESQSRPAQSKRQWQKSKAIITSDDDLELGEVVPTVPVRKECAVNMIYKPGQLTKVVTEQKTCRSLRHSVVASNDDMDTDTATNTGPPPKMGVPYVELPPAPATSSGPQLKEDDFADTTAPSWAPHCGQCVAWDLICHQAFNKDHGGKLRAEDSLWRKRLRGSRCEREVCDILPDLFSISPPAHNTATHVKPSVPDTTTTVQNEDEVPTHPSTSIPPPPSASTDCDSVLALQAEVATLCTAVAALEDQVVAGDKQCEDNKRRATSPTTECGTEATGESAAGESLASDSTTEASSASADPTSKVTGQSAAVPLTHTAESSSESAAGLANLVDDSPCSLASLVVE
ncbi:hypothetical protein F4604DRAFT_1686436 [Suillus subluteus]|nr:hypothetical protein F4604DRAFT_1686436 [Suillus subluteus]